MPQLIPRVGKSIVAVGEHLTPRKYAEVLSKVLGKEFKVKPISFDDFHALGKAPNPFVVEMYLNLKCVYSSGATHMRSP